LEKNQLAQAIYQSSGDKKIYQKAAVTKWWRIISEYALLAASHTIANRIAKFQKLVAETPAVAGQKTCRRIASQSPVYCNRCWIVDTSICLR
jgi:hypothetical protein